MTTIPTTEELINLFDQGMLAVEMAHKFRLNAPAELEAVEVRCVELHNAGFIDLLRLVESDALQVLNGADFFKAMHFFCRILPELEAPPARMMACVEALVTRGGEDMMASKPNAAFRAWCTKDPRRAREVIAAAQGGDDLASRHLTFALEARHAIIKARQIALAYDGTRRLSAITALGRMKDDDPASCAETLVTFSKLLGTGADDNLRANMLQATAAIIARDLDAHSPMVVNLVSRLVEEAGEATVHQSAHILWANREALQPEIIASLLKALSHINPTNKGTVRELDFGLQSLLESGHDEAAIGYVTQLLSRQDNDLGLDEFNSFTNTLISGPIERLSRVVVQWFLIGMTRLCDGLSKAIRSRGSMDGPPLNLRAEDLAISPTAQVFICRKAIGWFLFKPTTAASVVVSVLRICDAETALKVQKLLSEILLLNYSGVREYLEALAPDDAAKGRVSQCLADSAAYLTALKAIPIIKELEPSEHHRRIERLRMSDQMRDVHKQARARSVFLNLVKQSVLLYGNRSVSFIKDGNDALRPVEMDLKPYGVSFEMPRMEIIDPVGLEHMLNVFRSERLLS